MTMINVRTTLESHPAFSTVIESDLDDDTMDYIQSLLDSHFEDEDDKDEDDEEEMEETIRAMLQGCLEDEEEMVEDLVKMLFKKKGNKSNDDNDVGGVTKLLKKSIRMADGAAKPAPIIVQDGKINDDRTSIQNFYANMIGIRTSDVVSERSRRKAAQRVLREKKAEQDLLDRIRHEMERAATSEEKEGEDGTDGGADFVVDVHVRDLSLPNKKGSGPDLLQNSNVTLSAGRRYGLLGKNGCGKTTFMELMASRGEEMAGCVPSNMSMLLVRQEIVGDSRTAVDCVMQSDVRIEGLKRFIKMCESSTVPKAEEEETMKKLAAAYERMALLEEMEGPPEPRARKVLSGLGFTEEMQDKPTKQLSGGWRMRVSLANALFANPSLLLLDEPTNHLDLEAVLWLERYLTTKFKGTLLLVSHDRHFLNEVVTDVVHFYREELTSYKGDISNFEAVREENKLRQIRLRETQEAKREHLQKYIDLHAQSGENGVKAAKQRKSKMKKLDKLGTMAQEGRRYKASYDGDAEEVKEFVEDEEVVITFPDPGSFNGDIVKLDQATFGYTKDHMLLQNVDLTIDMRSRAALLGRNGCGKSTLIKMIVGSLTPLKGKSTIDARAKVEYLAQHQLEQLDPNGTPLGAMLERYPGDGGDAHKLTLRRYLANFGLGGEVLPLQKISTMSGGQKCRVCLANAMYRQPHLLVLDEPTNHLDLETTEALIEAIKDFKGGVLLVSHDQHLLTNACKDLYVVENGKVEKLRHGTTNGDAFKAYKKAVIQGRR